MTSAQRRTATVLVVDDDPAIRELLTLALDRNGHRVVAAADGVEALDRLRESLPDVVLTDIVLPRLDGYGLVRAIRSDERTASLPVVFQTANYLERELEEFARATGVVRTLVKPTPLEAIEEAVQAALASRPVHEVAEPEAELDREHLRLVSEKLVEKVHELEEANERLRRADADRGRLLRHLVRAQENERKAIAEDIHDDTIQVMSAVAMQLHALRRVVTPDGGELLQRLEDVVQQAIGRLRGFLVDLRPPELDHGSLRSALEGLADREARRGDLSWSVRVELAQEPPPETRAIAYRIVQEALSTAREEAPQCRVEVCVDDEPGGMLVTVVDDAGVFASREDGAGEAVGLLQVRERAELAGGWLRLVPREGRRALSVFLPYSGTP